MIATALDNEPEEQIETDVTDELATDEIEEEIPEADNSEEEESESDETEEESEAPDDIDLSLEDSSESEEAGETSRWSDRFKPDPSLDPAVQERFRQQIDGVQKTVERETAEAFAPIIRIEQNLRSPELYVQQMEKLLDDVNALHGTQYRLASQDDYQEFDDTYELPEVKAVKTELSDTKKRLADLEAKLGTREQEERQKALDASWLASKGEAAVKLTATKLGLTISPQEALAAVKAWPSKDPLAAINAEYGLTHKAKQTKPKKGGNVLPEANKGLIEKPVMRSDWTLDTAALVSKYV